MESTVVPPSFNADQERLIKFIFDEADGRVIDLSNLSSAPTTAGAELNEGQKGIYSSSLYWNILGTIYKIALTTT